MEGNVGEYYYTQWEGEGEPYMWFWDFKGGMIVLKDNSESVLQSGWRFCRSSNLKNVCLSLGSSHRGAPRRIRLI